MTRITRIEVIDENGRSYVNWEDDKENEQCTWNYDWWEEYPTNTWQNDVNRWDSFQAGYNASKETAQERGERLHKDVERVVKENMKWFEEHPDESVEDWLKPQTPEELAH